MALVCLICAEYFSGHPLLLVCPAVGDSRFRPEALALSGKAQFPVLVDPNYDPPLVITESTSIVKHLWSNYGNAATEPLHAKVSSGGMYCFLHAHLMPASALSFCPSAG